MIAAFVSIRPLSVSAFAPVPSVAVIVWFNAVTVPAAALGVPPTPPALPTPVTESPRLTAVVDVLIVFRPVAPSSWMTAMSSVGSVPTTVAV